MIGLDEAGERSRRLEQVGTRLRELSIGTNLAVRSSEAHPARSQRFAGNRSNGS